MPSSWVFVLHVKEFRNSNPWNNQKYSEGLSIFAFLYRCKQLHTNFKLLRSGQYACVNGLSVVISPLVVHLFLSTSCITPCDSGSFSKESSVSALILSCSSTCAGIHASCSSHCKDTGADMRESFTVNRSFNCGDNICDIRKSCAANCTSSCVHNRVSNENIWDCCANICDDTSAICWVIRASCSLNCVDISVDICVDI